MPCAWCKGRFRHEANCAKPGHLVLDLDGTLTDGDWQGGISIPRFEAFAKARTHIESGGQVTILTARPVRLREVTEQLVHEVLGHKVSIVMWPEEVEFKWQHYVGWKARHLRNLRADHYVGDLPDDALAAKEAGVKFTDANAWIEVVA